MTKLEEILTDVRQGSIDVEDAASMIRSLFSAILDESSFGISSVDATELWGAMRQGIESA